MTPKITLRYFDARGRAQFLRNYFACRGIEYEDERVPLSADFSEWMAIRGDRSITGPLQRLPILHWNDRMLPETWVIASFLHEQCGDAAVLNESQNLNHQVLVSTLCIDLMLPLGMLIWSERMYPGSDQGAAAKQSFDRIKHYLSVLNTALEEWRWLDESSGRPVLLADCLLWDGLSTAQLVFGEYLRIEDTPTLARFFKECPGRRAFENLLSAHPCQITGTPSEAEVLPRIRARLAEAIDAG